MKRVCILGATGSIGRQALEVCAAAPDEFEVIAVSAHHNVGMLREMADRFRPRWVGIADENASRQANWNGAKVITGAQAASELATLAEVDVVVAGIVGFAGLESTLQALRAGKTVALANKESLVVAGELCMAASRASGATLIPVDSEHSAIFQAIGGHSISQVARILLTGSGGPFRGRSSSEIAHATVAEALKHPTWNMGPKISIDSATLMNKALEVIEAHFLFNIPPDRIEIILHPESYVHSMVEFVDGAILAQLGDHDMRGPIGYALTYPERRALGVRRLDLTDIGRLSFESPDANRFPCVSLGHEALRKGGTAPVALSAANEVAVQAFLEGRISFPRIAELIGEALDEHRALPARDLSTIAEADRLARSVAIEKVSG